MSRPPGSRGGALSLVRDGYALVAGRRAHYAQAGSGPPVMLAPGLGLSTRFYAPTLRALGTAGVRLIAPDLPSFGRSPGPARGMTVTDTADWLLELATVLGVEGPGWLGHSIGCQVAIDIAAREPARAAALVLAAPTGMPGRGRLARQFTALFGAVLVEPLGLLGAVMRDYVHVLPTAYLGTWIQAARDEPVPKLGRIRCPTLLLRGQRDPVVPNRFMETLLHGIEGARLLRIRSGSHGLPRDAVHPFAAVTAPFFREAMGC